MKVGDRVQTPHGLGTITGKDLPESRAWRWMVQLDNPREEDLADILCYWERELEEEAA